MVRTSRPFLAATLVALHAAVALGGPGLHALPGWGHGSGLTRLAKNDHSHGPGKSSHEATDECPVCHFLAQGQLSADLTAGAPGWLVVQAEVARAAVPAPTPTHRSSIPRAPPAALLG
jgi:hypothetical protein